MTYTVQQLSRLTGLTPRTLRYYDAIGLLRPKRQEGNDYRLYGRAEVERARQILVYRAMGLPLEEIGILLESGGETDVLQGHLRRLEKEKQETEKRIRMVRQALSGKGEVTMDFETLKQQALRENEERYGAELRETYGEDVVEEHNLRFAGMKESQWKRAAELEELYLGKLKEAMEQNDPGCMAAKEACRLHLGWLGCYWKKEQCVPGGHRGVVKLYEEDERFRAYYEEKVGPGCAAFFARAIDAYYEE